MGKEGCRGPQREEQSAGADGRTKGRAGILGPRFKSVVSGGVTSARLSFPAVI